MSFTNPNVELTYDGNGSDTTFDVNFAYLEGETSSIAVELWDYTLPNSPVQLSFVLNVDYTIDESSFPATEVITTLPVPLNHKLIIYRDTPKQQPVSLANGAFPAESVEEMVDRVAFMAQEHEAKFSRAIVNPIGGPSFSYQDLLDLQNNLSGSLIILNNTNAPTFLNHAASTGEYIIVKNSHTTIALPDPTEPLQFIRVKVSGQHDLVNLFASGTSIDGFGTGYALESSYEAVTLVSDGTQWYIF